MARFKKFNESLEEAKRALAEELGVDVEDIEESNDCWPNGDYCLKVGKAIYVVYEDWGKAYEAAVKYQANFFDGEGARFLKDCDCPLAIQIKNYGLGLNEDWFEEAKEEEIEYMRDSPDEHSEDDIKSMESYDDPVQWYIDMFGEEAFGEAVKANNLIDWKEVAEWVVDQDGVGMALASYDSNEIEIPNGYYAYRVS